MFIKTETDLQNRDAIMHFMAHALSHLTSETIEIPPTCPIAGSGLLYDALKPVCGDYLSFFNTETCLYSGAAIVSFVFKDVSFVIVLSNHVYTLRISSVDSVSINNMLDDLSGSYDIAGYTMEL